MISQENFCYGGVVMYFLHDRESQRIFSHRYLNYFCIKTQYADIRAAYAENELGPLTCIFVARQGKATVTPGQADFILLNLFSSLHQLVIDVWKPVYKR